MKPMYNLRAVRKAKVYLTSSKITSVKFHFSFPVGYILDKPLNALFSTILA